MNARQKYEKAKKMAFGAQAGAAKKTEPGTAIAVRTKANGEGKGGPGNENR